MKKMYTAIVLFLSMALLVPVFHACQPMDGVLDGSQPDGDQSDETDTKTTDDTVAVTDGTPTEKKPDLSGAMFDPNKVIKIAIQIPVEDWDTIRKQSRDYDNFLAPDCLLKPFPKSFTYKKATVSINGIVVKDVGLRKKGFVGSIDENKPSLKIKFDEFVPKQEFSSLERMTLNNNKADPTFMRQCLTYNLFNQAGIPAPRCNFVHLTINGKELGIFTHLESMKKRFLARHYEKNDGDLYEGTLSDFREGWTATFEAKNDKPDRTKLTAVVEASKLSDDKLLASLAKVINLDQFITFWAVEYIVNHLDGYAGNTNNFYTYLNPTTGLFEFMPWGVDATLLNRSWDSRTNPPDLLVRGILARRLYEHPEGKKKYTAAVQKLLDTVWKEDTLLKEIDRMEKLLSPFAAGDYFVKDQLNSGTTFTKLVDETRDFVRGRRARLKAILDKTITITEPLRDKICIKIAGESKGLFSTKVGTLNAQNPFAAGSGSFGGDFNGQTITASNVGSTAGLDPNDSSRINIQVFAQISQTNIMVAVLSIPASAYAENTPISIPGMFSRGKSGLLIYDTTHKLSYLVGTLWSGTITFSKAGAGKDAPIAGTFSAKWIQQVDPNYECFKQCLNTQKTSEICKGIVNNFRACTQGGKSPQECISQCSK